MTEAWNIIQADDKPDSWLIARPARDVTDTGLVVGSIVRQLNRRWRVEILWSGANGDVTFLGPFPECVAFVRGVEAMMMRTAA